MIDKFRARMIAERVLRLPKAERSADMTFLAEQIVLLTEPSPEIKAASARALRRMRGLAA